MSTITNPRRRSLEIGGTAARDDELGVPWAFPAGVTAIVPCQPSAGSAATRAPRSAAPTCSHGPACGAAPARRGHRHERDGTARGRTGAALRCTRAMVSRAPPRSRPISAAAACAISRASSTMSS